MATRRPNHKTLKALIFCALSGDYLRHGLTTTECALYLGKPVRSVAPALYLMVQAGVLREANKTRPSLITGYESVVYLVA